MQGEPRSVAAPEATLRVGKSVARPAARDGRQQKSAAWQKYFLVSGELRRDRPFVCYHLSLERASLSSYEFSSPPRLAQTPGKTVAGSSIS
jgi:hypothetical protein